MPSAVSSSSTANAARTTVANTFDLGPNTFKAGANSTVALAARRNSSAATADIFQVQDESGGRLVYIEPDGSLWVATTFTAGDGSYYSEHSLDVTVTANYQTGNNFDQELIGLYAQVQSAPTNIPVLSDMIGVYGVVRHAAVQELPVAWGGYYTVINDAAGTIDLAAAFYGQIINRAGGVITDARGAWIDSPTFENSATIITNYGFYIDSQLHASITTTYALWTNGGETRHKAGAAAVTPLTLQLDASQSADAFAVLASNGTTKLARIDKSGYQIISRTSAPADAALSAGEVALWLDQTNGLSKLMVKGRSANGTVATGSVVLT
jgi:hypothetical protein